MVLYSIEAHEGSDLVRIVLSRKNRWWVGGSDVLPFMTNLVGTTEVFPDTICTEMSVSCMFSTKAATGVVNTIRIVDDKIVIITLTRKSTAKVRDIDNYAQFLANEFDKFLAKIEEFFPKIYLNGVSVCGD